MDIQYSSGNAPFPNRSGTSLLGEVLEHLQVVSGRVFPRRGTSCYHIRALCHLLLPNSYLFQVQECFQNGRLPGSPDV